MELADTLSRAHGLPGDATAFERKAETVNMTQYLSISAARLEDIKDHDQTRKDGDIEVVIEVVKSG